MFGLLNLKRAIGKSTTTATYFQPSILVQQRNYQEKGLYGIRESRKFEFPEYTEEELNNRVANANLLRFIEAYRNFGHKAALLDPLKIHGGPKQPKELMESRYRINPDSEVTINANGLLNVSGAERIRVSDLIGHLKKTYCGHIGFEFQHLPNPVERDWWARQIESGQIERFEKEQKLEFWKLLAKSEVFDQFMTRKFPSVKRYGLEGAESTMIVLDVIFKTLNQANVNNIVLGMPHRGRLNLLVDLLKYPPRGLFRKVKGNAEFPEDEVEPFVVGDVLSHLVNSVDLDYGNSKSIHVSMLHNPSHLEAINPVAMGKARAKQMYLYDEQTEKDCFLGDRVACVQIHGDAAFCGQGIVMESLGLSDLAHFRSGGSIHVIVNNQIGYTTEAINSRSTVHPSDIAKCVDAPIIHVNGDFPEDVARATIYACLYRQTFRRDVVLDVVTYRRWGHNELDEPAFTQPSMYHEIRSRKSVPRLYEEELLNQGVLNGEIIEEVRGEWEKFLEEELKEAESFIPKADHLKGNWKDMIHPKETISVMDTGVEEDVLKMVGKASVMVPEGFVIHNRLSRLHVTPRLQKVENGKGLDWSTAEAMAFGSLLLEGYSVRISGQDVGRGTFSQRHIMFVDQNTEQVWVPLDNLKGKDLGRLEIANSSLSEMAVMGFEYGVSLESPQTLNIWEAQFGDFYNGAQIIIDNFIVSGEAKWLRQSGLTLFLPHGLENGGPEHSSGHFERFLQLCDDRFDVLNENILVNPAFHLIYPTTPAQHFHALRRQMLRPFRKPLIVMGPKSLLRHGLATSSLEDMKPGTSFKPIIGEDVDEEQVEKIVFLTGKLYYELYSKRKELELENKIVFIRLEELCPFPAMEIIQEFKKYPNVKKVVWIQEEPENQGGWIFVKSRLEQCIGRNIEFIGRKPSTVPSTGISKWFKIEQDSIINSVFV